MNNKVVVGISLGALVVGLLVLAIFLESLHSATVSGPLNGTMALYRTLDVWDVQRRIEGAEGQLRSVEGGISGLKATIRKLKHSGEVGSDLYDQLSAQESLADSIRANVTRLEAEKKTIMAECSSPGRRLHGHRYTYIESESYTDGVFHEYYIYRCIYCGKKKVLRVEVEGNRVGIREL